MGAADRIILEQITRAVVVSATAALPFLGLPIISVVFGLVVEKICGMFYTEASKYFLFKAIDSKTGGEAEALERAAKELHETLAPGTGGAPDAEAIAKAKELFKQKLSTLIGLGLES